MATHHKSRHIAFRRVPIEVDDPHSSRRSSFVLCFFFRCPDSFAILVVLFFFGGVPVGTATLFLPLVECNNTERWRRRHPIISRVNPPVHKTLENVYTYRIVSAAADTTASAVVYQQLWQRAVNCEEIYYTKAVPTIRFLCMYALVAV